MPNPLSIIKNKIKSSIPAAGKLVGVNILSKHETRDFLNNFMVYRSEGEKIYVPQSKVWGEGPKAFEEEIIGASELIGAYAVPGDKVKVYKHGGVKFGKNVLNLDFGSTQFLKSLVDIDKREVVHVEDCMPVWSHYWGAYFDFLFFIYGKALRIASVLTGEQRRSIKIAYPVFNKAFEKELWEIAGFSMDQIIDTRKYNIKAKKFYLSNNPSWFYHHMDDIKRLQQVISRVEIEPRPGDEFIYISRKGKRIVRNEDEIIKVLKSYNFKIIEDIPRSNAEQMAIFNNAKVIIGPHGAAYANIVWCKPKTHLVELFAKNYYLPYYRYLAVKLDLNYSAIFEKNVEDTHYSHLYGDMTIDPRRVQQAVEAIMLSLNINPKIKDTSLPVNSFVRVS